MGTVSLESRHLSTHVERAWQDVYDYVAEPTHMIEWAPGLGTSIEPEGDAWVMDSPMGRIVVTFTPRNEFGVADHEVTVPSGETMYNPMRVVRDGDGCEVVFSVRRRAGMSDDDFDRDTKAVQADLDTLKRLMERTSA